MKALFFLVDLIKQLLPNAVNELILKYAALVTVAQFPYEVRKWMVLFLGN
jgi:hypothetical protein